MLFVGIDASPQGFAVCLLTLKLTPERFVGARVITFVEEKTVQQAGELVCKEVEAVTGLPGMRTDLPWKTRFELVALPWKKRKRFLESWVKDTHEIVLRMKQYLTKQDWKPDYVLIESPIPFSVKRPQTQALSLNVMYESVKNMARQLWSEATTLDVNAQNAKASFVPVAQKPHGGRLATKTQIYEQFQDIFQVDLLELLKAPSPERHPVSDIVDAVAIAFTGWQRLVFMDRSQLSTVTQNSSGPFSELSLEPPVRTEQDWLVAYRLWRGEQAVEPPHIPDSVPVPSTLINRMALSWLHQSSLAEAWQHLQYLEPVIQDVRTAEKDLFQSQTLLLLFYEEQCRRLSFLAANPSVQAWLLQHAAFLRQLSQMTDSLTDIMHPLSALQLRNHMVESLSQILHNYMVPLMQTYMERFDPLSFWQKVSKGQRPKKRPQALIEARGPFIYWLDLCYRLINIPHRTQVSQHLKWGPEVTMPYVSKLVQVGNVFNRIWYADKVGYQASHMPTSFPLDELLSAVTFFYLYYVRHTPGKQTKQGANPAEYVFLGERGGLWTSHMTKEYKQWIKDTLHMNTDRLESKGNKNFLHRIRNIMLSSYGVLTRFEFTKLENLALAMRHSLVTMNRNYLDLWSRWFQDLEAVAAYASKQGWEIPETWIQSQNLYVAQLKPLPDVLMTHIQQKMKAWEFLNADFEPVTCEKLKPLPLLKQPWLTREEAETLVNDQQWPEQAPPPLCRQHHILMRYTGKHFVCPLGPEKRKIISINL